MDDVPGTPTSRPAVGHQLPDGRRLVVGGVLVRGRAGARELLAARRIEPPELAGGWELPGGKVEPGESEEQALARELREELGIVVGGLDPVPGPDAGGWPLGGDYLMRVHLVTSWDGEPAPLEQHDALQWVPLDRWREPAWLDGDVAPVAAVVAALTADPQAPVPEP